MKFVNKYFEKTNIPGTSFFFGEYFILFSMVVMVLFVLSFYLGFWVFNSII